LYRSPKELHFRDYSLPEGVSSVVPSGVNNLASHHCKCYLLTIVCRMLCVVIRSTHINHLVASGFMKTSYTLRSLGYPMPPPLVLEFNGELLNQFEDRFGELRAWKGYPFGAPPNDYFERLGETSKGSCDKYIP